MPISRSMPVTSPGQGSLSLRADEAALDFGIGIELEGEDGESAAWDGRSEFDRFCSMAEMICSLTPAFLRAMRAETEVSKEVSELWMSLTTVLSSKPAFTISTTSSFMRSFFVCPLAKAARRMEMPRTFTVEWSFMNNLASFLLSHTGDVFY